MGPAKVIDHGADGARFAWNKLISTATWPYTPTDVHADWPRDPWAVGRMAIGRRQLVTSGETVDRLRQRC
jgi:hypothetical protein